MQRDEGRPQVSNGTPTVDPNEAYQNMMRAAMRAARAINNDPARPDPDDIDALVEAVLNLDEWMARETGMRPGANTRRIT